MEKRFKDQSADPRILTVLTNMVSETEELESLPKLQEVLDNRISSLEKRSGEEKNLR